MSGQKLATLLILSTFVGCITAQPAIDSPQHNGDVFVNPKPVEPPGAFSIAWHILFGRDGQWPSKVRGVEAELDLDRPLEDQEVAVTFVNHATVLIQLKGLTILTDPVWSKRVGPFSWAGPLRATEPGITFDKLPPIDIVVLSHNHYDHLDLPTLKKLHKRDKPKVFVPLGDKALLQGAGIQDVVELDWWQRTSIAQDIEVIFTPTQHNSGRSPWTNNKSLWGSWFIRHRTKSIYFGGDTAYEAHFKAIRERLGEPDLAFLPIGAYLPREKMKMFHMDPAQAVQAHIDLGAKRSVGIHFGTFQLTGEDFDAPPRDLSRALSKADKLPGPFLVLKEGKTRVFRMD